MVKNFKDLFYSLGFKEKTLNEVTKRLYIYSFEDFRGRIQLLSDINHAALDCISRNEQERLHFLILFMTMNVGVGVNWDKWIDDNEYEASRLNEYIKENTPKCELVLTNKRTVYNYNYVGEKLLAGEKPNGETFLYKEPQSHFDLEHCVMCGVGEAHGIFGLKKCMCGRYVYCSYTCQKVHWRGIHSYLCPKNPKLLNLKRISS